MDGNRLLNQKGLAQFLGINRTTILRWHWKQIGPPRLLIRKRYYYTVGAVEEWLETLNDLSLRTLALDAPLQAPDPPSPTAQNHSLESAL